jgi:hypothetical protein
MKQNKIKYGLILNCFNFYSFFLNIQVGELAWKTPILLMITLETETLFSEFSTVTEVYLK